MNDLQNQVNARVEDFVAEITELARQAAYEALTSALEHGQPMPGRGAVAAFRRRGGKRTPEELASMSASFLDYVTKNPGERMEHIAQQLGYSTPELNLPVKKLVSAGKLHLEGQKRATRYYPATSGENGASKASVTRSRKRKGRRRRKAA